MALANINLDNKTFTQLVDEALKYIPIYAPRWTDHNLHDPGITMIDLFSWLTEMQLFSLNQVTGRHLSKYLSLLGVQPSPALLPEVEVQLSSTAFTTIPQGTLFYTHPSDEGAIFESSESMDIIPVTIEKVISYSDYRYIDVSPFNLQVRSYYHAFGETPSPGDALYLGLSSTVATSGLEGRSLRLTVYTYEDDLPPAGSGCTVSSETPLTNFPVFPSARVTWEYWNGIIWQELSISAEADTIPVLSAKGSISLDLPGDLHTGAPIAFPGDIGGTAGIFWFRCRLLQAQYELPPRIDRILTNAVSAVENRNLQDQPDDSNIMTAIPGGALTFCDIPGVTVTNPYPSTTGQAEESIDEAFLRTRKDLAIPGTATTAADYEFIAKATPGLRVARAKAVIPDLNQNHVTVAVVPYSFQGKPLPGSGFKQTVCRYVDAHRPVTTKISICDPDYVNVWAAVTVTLENGYQPQQVSIRIDEALNKFLSPLGSGGEHEGWPFGRPVYRSEIYELLESVPGVHCITALTLYADASEGAWEKKEGDIIIGKLSLVYPGSHQIDINDSFRKCKQS